MELLYLFFLYNRINILMHYYPTVIPVTNINKLLCFVVLPTDHCDHWLTDSISRTLLQNVFYFK